MKTETMTFVEELSNLINRHSQENGSDTPDWILAEYLSECLLNFNRIMQRREKWYGREKSLPVSQWMKMPEQAEKLLDK